MERTAILDVVYLVVVVVFLFFIDFCLLSRGKSTTIEFVRGFCTAAAAVAAAPVFAAAASAAASLLGWGLKSARTTHRNTHSDPKATHTHTQYIKIHMYLCITHKSMFAYVCVFAL